MPMRTSRHAIGRVERDLFLSYAAISKARFRLSSLCFLFQTFGHHTSLLSSLLSNAAQSAGAAQSMRLDAAISLIFMGKRGAIEQQKTRLASRRRLHDVHAPVASHGRDHIFDNSAHGRQMPSNRLSVSFDAR